MTEELKPCPFCGGVADTDWKPGYGYFASCKYFDECPVEPSTDGYPTEAEAITAWNRREG